MNRKLLALLMMAGALALSGCEKQGKLEQAGEEVDEAIQTIKEGEEPTSAKIDDAIDEAKEGVKETAEELKK